MLTEEIHATQLQRLVEGSRLLIPTSNSDHCPDLFYAGAVATSRSNRTARTTPRRDEQLSDRHNRKDSIVLLERNRKRTRALRTGEAGQALYILSQGQVSIRLGGKEEVLLGNYTETGSFFGEIILVDPGPRSASGLADEKSHVLNINMRLLSALFTNDPSLEATVMRNLARALAQHLRRANTERAQGYHSESDNKKEPSHRKTAARRLRAGNPYGEPPTPIIGSTEHQLGCISQSGLGPGEFRGNTALGKLPRVPVSDGDHQIPAVPWRSRHVPRQPGASCRHNPRHLHPLRHLSAILSLTQHQQRAAPAA